MPEGRAFFMTQLAIDRAKQQVSRREPPTQGLRVGVMGAGCSGLNYKIEFVTNISAADHVFEFQGLKIVIDPKSYPYLAGATLDWSSTLIEHGFIFHNPNAKATCGCGDSFTV